MNSGVVGNIGVFRGKNVAGCALRDNLLLRQEGEGRREGEGEGTSRPLHNICTSRSSISYTFLILFIATFKQLLFYFTIYKI